MGRIKTCRFCELEFELPLNGRKPGPIDVCLPCWEEGLGAREVPKVRGVSPDKGGPVERLTDYKTFRRTNKYFLNYKARPKDRRR